MGLLEILAEGKSIMGYQFCCERCFRMTERTTIGNEPIPKYCQECELNEKT